MVISIERRCGGAGPHPIRFALVARALDVETHDSMTRANHQAIRAELAKAADAIERVLAIATGRQDDTEGAR